MSIRADFIKTPLLAALATAALTFTAAASASDNTPGYANGGDAAPSAAAMTADLVLARPIGFGATILGSIVFVVALPFELLSGNVSAPARKLVVEPARYTFTRPLGEDVN